MTSADFPLVTLHPIADQHHRWTGLLVQSASDRAGVLQRLFGEFGLLDALGGLPCVLSLNELPGDDGIADFADLLPAEQVFLRIPAAHCVDPAAAGTLAALQGRGFRLMADGLPATGALPAAVSCLALESAPDGVDATARTLLMERPGPHLALHVESASHFSGCSRSGFRWLAGNYPLHPEEKPKGGPARTVMLRLLAEVVRDADSKEIEATLKLDPQLAFQLLKLVNSAAFSLTTRITSFGQAITLLGRRQLQRWLQLLLYARPAGSGDEASPLMPRAALRAGTMEGLARAGGAARDEQDRAFMVGMFSLLETQFGQSAADFIRPLNLADDIGAALVAYEGRLGRLLKAVETAELGPGPDATAALAAAGVGHEVWCRTLAESCNWAIQVSREA